MSVVESLEFLVAQLFVDIIGIPLPKLNILNKFINDSEAVFIIHNYMYPLICISNNPSIVDNS